MSNDLFRDYIDKFFKRKSQKIPDKTKVNQMVEAERSWLKHHVVSYTFVLEEFQPNPDSTLFELM